jgi:hypothetical protein
MISALIFNTALPRRPGLICLDSVGGSKLAVSFNESFRLAVLGRK